MSWAAATFGALPPTFVGGFGVALLLIGVFLGVSGFRMVPTSFGLVGAGIGCVVLTYFVVGAAVSSASSTLAGTSNVQAAAPRVVPWAAAAVLVGLAMFGFRKALSSWASEETSGKAAGAIVALLSVAVMFVGVQVVRGSFATGAAAPTAGPAETDGNAPPPGDDQIRRRGAAGPRR